MDKPKIEGVIPVKNGNDLSGIYWRNKEGHWLYFTVSEAGPDEIIALLDPDVSLPK